MRVRKAISTVESVIIICMISSGFILVISKFGSSVVHPLEQTAQSFGGSLASVSSEHPSVEPPNNWTFQPFSHSVTVGLLALIAIAFGYLRYRPAKPEPGIKGTILNQLQKQIQNRGSPQSARLLEKRERIFRAFSGDSRSLLCNAIVAGDIMSLSPTCVSPETPKHTIVNRMRSADLRHLMVCDAPGNLVGIISDRDLNKKNCLSAEEMMTADPFTTDVESDISETISMILGNRISCIPVLNGKNLVGVISSSDICVTLQCTLSLLNSLFSPTDQNRSQTGNVQDPVRT